MSETNEALKAKYAEIANLKKEILEKKRANRNNSTYPSAHPSGGVGKAPFAARGGYSFRAGGGFRGGLEVDLEVDLEVGIEVVLPLAQVFLIEI